MKEKDMTKLSFLTSTCTRNRLPGKNKHTRPSKRLRFLRRQKVRRKSQSFFREMMLSQKLKRRCWKNKENNTAIPRAGKKKNTKLTKSFKKTSRQTSMNLIRITTRKLENFLRYLKTKELWKICKLKHLTFCTKGWAIDRSSFMPF